MKDYTIIQIRKIAKEKIPHDKMLTLVPIGENWDNYFSKSPCECCGDWLAGDRIDCQAITENGVDPFNYSVCPDCLCLFQ